VILNYVPRCADAVPLCSQRAPQPVQWQAGQASDLHRVACLMHEPGSGHPRAAAPQEVAA
jgi:peptide/nickel transport system ATP-binding protein